MATAWFPRIAPDGTHLAAGNATIHVWDLAPATGVLSNERTFSPGISPCWLSASALIYHNRQDPPNARMVKLPSPFTTPVDLITVGSTAHDAGGSHVAVYVAATPFNVRVFDGTSGALVATYGSQALPSVDTGGRVAAVARSDDGIFVNGTRIVNEPGVATPRIATGGAVWSKYGAQRRTHGWRGAGIEDLTVFSVHEFAPVAVDTPSGPWVLLYTESGGAPGLYLHPWGNTQTVLVAPGGANVIQYPHAVYHSGTGRFLVTWNSASALLHVTSIAVNVADPIYTTGSGAGSPSGGSGTGTNAPITTPTGKIAEAVVLASARAHKRIYPHVTNVQDQSAKRTLRLLWDRVHDMDEQLSGQRPSALQATTAAVAKNLTTYKSSQARVIAQLAASTTGAPLTIHPLPGGGGSGSGGGGQPPGGGGGGGGEPPPPPPGGGGDIGNHLDVVVAARATWDHIGPSVERGGRITNQVAWDLKNLGVGVLHKTGGTNYHQWSIDVIVVSPGGASYDILGDAEGNANPQWGRTSPSGFSDINLWRAPIDPTSF